MPVGDWLVVIRRYVIATGLGNLTWEFAQLPLYTVWRDGTVPQIVFAAVHCTGGDLIIASLALVGSLVVAGNRNWPHARFGRVAFAAIVVGLVYAVFSEWLNTEIRGSWAYTEWMPTMPLIGAGVAPLVQWLVVPALALLWARRGTLPDALSRFPGAHGRPSDALSDPPHGIDQQRNDVDRV